MGFIKGATVLLPILVAAVVGAVVIAPAGLLLVFIPGMRWGYHLWVDVLKKQWFIAVSLLLNYFGGIKIYAYGDVPRDEHALILSNHRTRVDWMILWGYLMRCPGKKLRELRIVLKRELKKLPIFGWAMAVFRFIFLSRDWAKDQLVLSKLIDYYEAHREQVSLLIFPEGTDLHKSALEKSKKYAEQNQQPVLNHVLYPRSTGTQFILDKMEGSFDAVWDITLGYKDRVPGERPDEKKFASGKFPQEVHVLLKRHEMKEFPKGAAEFPAWLRASFIEKEKALETFYASNHKFDAPRVPLSASPVTVLSCLAYWSVALYATFWLLSSWIGVLLIVLSITANAMYGPRQDELLM